MTYKNRRKAKIEVKSATLRHDVLSIAREASAAPAATFKRGNRKFHSTQNVAAKRAIERPAAKVQFLALPFKVNARSAATIGVTR
jgi:hypothetical protein